MVVAERMADVVVMRTVETSDVIGDALPITVPVPVSDGTMLVVDVDMAGPAFARLALAPDQVHGGTAVVNGSRRDTDERVSWSYERHAMETEKTRSLTDCREARLIRWPAAPALARKLTRVVVVLGRASVIGFELVGDGVVEQKKSVDRMPCCARYRRSKIGSSCGEVVVWGLQRIARMAEWLAVHQGWYWVVD